jgi:hypothetical protein
MSYALALLAVFFLACPVYGQAHGEVFASAGPILSGDGDAHFSVSFGSEQISAQGLSGGVDGVILSGRTGPRPGAPSGEPYRQLVLSGLVGAHSRRTRGMAPFVSGGLSLVTDPDCCGSGLAWTIGGGARYWLTSRVGIRAGAKLVLGFGEGGMVLGGIGIVFRRMPDRVSSE